jgi:hypothetical protein
VCMCVKMCKYVSVSMCIYECAYVCLCTVCVFSLPNIVCVFARVLIFPSPSRCDHGVFLPIHFVSVR